MALPVFIGLVLALVAQHRAAVRREQTLKAEWAQDRHYRYARESIDQLIGDLGVVILESPTGIELLRVTHAAKASPGGGWGDPVATATGKELDPEAALRVARALLDRRNHGFLNASDDSDPQVGLRVKRGRDSVDVLISLEGSSKASPHQDVWIEVHDGDGKRIHAGGPMCFGDPDLQKLAEELLGGRLGRTLAD
jgi:hypothetical protein